MPTRTKTTPPGPVAQLGALLDQAGMRGRGRSSPLARWLLIHHDAFLALLAEKHPSWEELATGLAALGVRDGDGKPPTSERTRKAWWGVRRAKAAKRLPRSQTATPPPPLAPGEIAPGVRATATQASAVANPSVRPSPSGQASLAGTRSDLDQAADENDPMRRLRASMNKAKVPMPRPV